MFNFDDIQTLEGAFTNHFRSYLLRTLFGIAVWGAALNELTNPALKEGKKAQNLGFVFGPRTSYIPYLTKFEPFFLSPAL